MRAIGTLEIRGRAKTNDIDICGIDYFRPFTRELAKEQSWKGCFGYSLSEALALVQLLWPFDKLASPAIARWFLLKA